MLAIWTLPGLVRNLHATHFAAFFSEVRLHHGHNDLRIEGPTSSGEGPMIADRDSCKSFVNWFEEKLRQESPSAPSIASMTG